MATIKSETIEIVPIRTETVYFALRGTSPLIVNRMSEKAKFQLLMGGTKKTAAEKASSLKHNPIEEFRASVYRTKAPDAKTLLAMPATAFKGALRSAALDMPGTKKTEIGRLTYVPLEQVEIYGVPRVYCAITRSSDIARTPDVRTRAILPEWCAIVPVTFAVPRLNAKSITNLIAAAGHTVGVGDYRPEKGAGSFGMYTVCTADDKDVVRIMRDGGRKAQQAALDEPVPYDAESQELLSWFDSEVDRRGLKVPV